MIEEIISVALPIGNTEDLSFRARKVLEQVDGVLAEDTRKFKEFIRYSGLKTSAELIALPSFEEKEVDFSAFFKKLNGRKWALVSDAGTPAVSDPGGWVVRAARRQKIKVSALPGPSALTMAVQITGGFGLPLCFLGFAPKKNKKEFFERADGKTLVFFESKHEILNCLEYLTQHFAASRLFILREMSKEHEEFFEGHAPELLKIFAQRLASDEPIGELTLVLEGRDATASVAPAITAQELADFRSAPPGTAAKMLAKFSGLSREKAYELLSKK